MKRAAPPLHDDELVRDLQRPGAYPDPRPAQIELRETHLSRVFLTEGDVYKVKKAIDLGFVDFTTLEARRAACEAEVVLNARLAASVYLGVVAVRRDADGRLGFGAEGEIVDWAVHMLRMPDALRADVRLARGELGADDVLRLAEHLAAFHARCRADAETAAYGAPSVVGENVEENFAQTEGVVARLLSGGAAREIEARQRAFVRDEAPLLEARQRGGFVREGHGDLRLEHVYLDDGGGITILDCIEFSERFRCADVCADVAFLSMDLAAHGRADLGELFLARYARESDDFDLYALVDFYESYRAYVRGKVASIRAAGARDPEQRARAEDEARRHFVLSLSRARRRVSAPVVVAVGGLIASGKSTIAGALAARAACPVIDADRTRKAMLGVGARDPLRVGAFEGPYDPRVTAAVYDELLRRAGVVVDSGRSVVLDASFRTAELRARARDMARAHGARFLFVECRVPRDVALARLEERERQSGVSDGRRAIYDDFAARAEPFGDAEGDRVVLDTTRPLRESLCRLEGRLRPSSRVA